MKNLRSFLAAAFVACLVFCGYAGNWEYDSTSNPATISDGVWTFEAKLTGSNITINNITTNDCPNPTEVTPLDFSKKVVKKGDASTEYTISDIEALFHYYLKDHFYKDGYKYVGEFTLPGDGLVKMGDDGLRVKAAADANAFGDIVIPTTITSIGRYWFQYSKISSVTFEANAGATIGSECFGGCLSLTSVVFKAGGKYTINNNARPFSGCSALKNADISGVVSVGGDKSHAAFGSCSAMTNVIINSDIVLYNTGDGTVWNSLFNGNANIETIRFTGAVPDDFETWVTGDNRYLDVLQSTKSITTIIPAQYRNTTNAQGKCWADYSASGKLNTTDSTFASTYVKSDVTDLSKRKLILDRLPDDDPPVITNVAASAIAAYQATVTVGGYGLNSGTISVSLTNSTGTVAGAAELSDFGTGHTFTGLNYSTLYSVIAVATNRYGSVTNATYSFTTAEQPPQVSVEAGANADEKTCTAGSFTISRSVAKDNDLVVKYTMSGTATNGQSYATLSGTATIPANETSFTVEVTPLYNPYMQEDSTATMTISTDSAYEIETGKGEASITVFDGGILGASVAKGGDADFNKSQNGSFVISRAAGDETVYPLTVKYAVGGTAVAGTDYTAIATTATIPAGSSSVVVSVIPLFCETKVAGDTQVDLSVSDDPTYVVGTRGATVKVAKVVVRHYSITAGVGPSGNTRGTFIVSRGANDPIDQKVTLTYTVSGAGADAIFELPGTVVIPAYATSATIEVFANNADGSDAQLVVTLDSGSYVLDSNSAKVTVAEGAASDFWSVDTTANTMSCGDWTLGIGIDVVKGGWYGVRCSGVVNSYPASTSPLDYSLPVVNTNNNQRYTITNIGVDNTAAAKLVVGELTLPGEGLTSIRYGGFNGCVNASGTLVFPTTLSGLGGQTFNNSGNVKIVGSSLVHMTGISGDNSFTGVSFVGEVLALSFEDIGDGGFAGSKIESIRFGPCLKKLGRNRSDRSGCFQSCASLTNVVFDQNSRVSLECGKTFTQCTALRSIDLSAVTNIMCGYFVSTNSQSGVISTNYNNGTFYNCSALTNVIFGADLHYLASNVFENAFDKSAESRTITFHGLPPEGFEMPYLSKLAINGSKGYPTITTYVHRKYLSQTNAVGKCWLDYAVDRKINRKDSTWASAFLPAEITDLTRRPLVTIEPDLSGFMIIVR